MYSLLIWRYISKPRGYYTIS